MSLFDGFTAPSFPDLSSKLQTAYTNVSNQVSDAVTKIKNTDPMTLLDPKNARLAVSDLLSGGVKTKATSTQASASFASTAEDWRVKVSLASGKGVDYFYKDSDPWILAPLTMTGGVIFPYTPQLSVTHAAKYNQQSLMHTNYASYSYESSEVQAISITGDFTAQNATEAAYVLACIHFFRSATKMWWNKDTNAGNPPPMVFLTGYGANYFPNVPCVVTSFTHTMPPDVDYVEAAKWKTGTMSSSSSVVSGAGTQFASANYTHRETTTTTMTNLKSTMIPTASQIQVTLQPIYSRKNVHENFSLDSFAKGTLLGSKDSGGFI